jgi:uracil-DNA glycosylase
VKCGDVQEARAEGRCLEHLRRELAVVEPKIVVAMGEETVAALNAAAVPLARELAYEPGEIAEFTPGTEVLVTPDIDVSLDEQRLKAGFWRAFRRLGEWYDAIPPY